MVLTTTFPAVEPAIRRVDLGELLGGVRLIRERADLMGLFLLTALPGFLVFPYISFLNVYALEVLDLGSSGYGLLMAASGLGAVVGGLSVAGGRRREGVGKTLLIRTGLYCLVIVALMAVPVLLVSLACLVIAGFLGAYAFSANNATIQQRITDELRGRVMGAYLLTWGLMPIGALWMGPLAQAAGIRFTTALGAGLCTIAIAVLALRSPALRSL
jgi:predicted MFS family arabinose efflux permease